MFEPIGSSKSFHLGTVELRSVVTPQAGWNTVSSEEAFSALITDGAVVEVSCD